MQDIVTNIDRVGAHLKGMKAGAELDDKTRDAVERVHERDGHRFIRWAEMSRRAVAA